MLRASHGAVKPQNSVLEAGGPCEWSAFAVHIAWDTLVAVTTVVGADDGSCSGSLLGLSDGEVAAGGLPGALVDVQSLFAAAGLALAIAGWYGYFVVLPAYVS